MVRQKGGKKRVVNVRRSDQRGDGRRPNSGPLGRRWQSRHGELTLTGWSRARRVVVLRRQLIGKVLLADEARQLELAFVESDVPVKRYEYAVLVTNVTHDVRATAQLYRDRADSENTFDELKNQWGWGGFTTSDLDRCQLSAMGVVLIYHWWSLFVRLANGCCAHDPARWTTTSGDNAHSRNQREIRHLTDRSQSPTKGMEKVYRYHSDCKHSRSQRGSPHANLLFRVYRQTAHSLDSRT